MDTAPTVAEPFSFLLSTTQGLYLGGKLGRASLGAKCGLTSADPV